MTALDSMPAMAGNGYCVNGAAQKGAPRDPDAGSQALDPARPWDSGEMEQVRVHP